MVGINGSANVVQMGGFSGATAHPGGLIIPADNPSGFFTLWTGGALTQDRFSPFYKNGVAYQVTNGKTFNGYQMGVICNQVSPGQQLVSDTVAIAYNTATALTAGVFQFGAAARASYFSPLTASTWLVQHMQYSFTSQTYPGVQIGNTGQWGIWLVGREI